jgi:hypothetical protein
VELHFFLRRAKQSLGRTRGGGWGGGGDLVRGDDLLLVPSTVRRMYGVRIGTNTCRSKPREDANGSNNDTKYSVLRTP